MIIEIDYRERQLRENVDVVISKWGLSKLKTDIKNLTVGDIVIRKGDSIRILVERKTLSDLASSLQDGRYNEQSFRLNNTPLHNHNIVYLIEGSLVDYDSKYSKITKRALMSCMVSLRYYKGYSVHTTNNIQETSEWLVNLADKLERKGPVLFYKNPNEYSVTTSAGGDSVLPKQIEYVSVTKRTKRSYINMDNIGIIMLSQIPGVSVATAEHTMGEFKTFKNLIGVIEKEPHKLGEVMIVGNTGKRRRISKTAVSNIQSFLLKKSPMVS